MVRFVLEINALIVFGFWGWMQSETHIRIVFAFGLPIVLSAAWGIFAVPNDPSRSGKAPVVISGKLRLVLELAFFGFAVWCLKDLLLSELSLAFAVVILIHYIVSYDRIQWLLKN
jgi:hypothetical protein